MRKLTFTSIMVLFLASSAIAADKVVVIPLNGSVTGILATPYQFVYSLSASPGSVSDCESIPVPDGKILTITSIGVTTNIDTSEEPDVHLTVGRSTGGGGASYRLGGSVNFTGESSGFKYYKGVYTLSTTVGNPSNNTSVSYSASICVSAPPGGTLHGSSARGVVSGYVTESTFIDGNSL